jgi:hypothetical protein
VTETTDTILIELTHDESTALDALCDQKEMSHEAVMRAALRLYQAVELGSADLLCGGRASPAHPPQSSPSSDEGNQSPHQCLE